jgi:type I restriction enzyme, S subunit
MSVKYFHPLKSVTFSVIDCPHSTPLWTESGKLVIRNFNIKNGQLNLSEKYFTNEENYIERTKRAKPEPGDLIITREAPMGEVCMVPEGIECCLGQRMVLIKPDPKLISKKYLLYAIQSKFVQKQIKVSDKTGSTVSNLRIPDLENLQIPRLDVKFENAIADFLFSLDAKIELNNRINAELEAMAKTLYDYWFVQFDFPDADGKPYKSSGGKMVWSEELKRDVPEGWSAGELSDIADLIRGVSYDKTDIKTSGSKGVIPILRATNVTGNVIDLQNMVYVTEENVSPKQFLNKYDILITMSSGSIDHIGKNGFFYFDCKVSYGTFCAKLVAKNNYKFYLFSYTQSDFMFQTIKNECLGTNINNLNSSLVNGFKIVIPANHLVSEFNTRVSNAFEKIGNNIRENQKLTELRDWLLPMLMNGQVKVGESKDKVYKVSEDQSYMMAAEPEVAYGKGRKG